MFNQTDFESVRGKKTYLINIGILHSSIVYYFRVLGNNYLLITCWAPKTNWCSMLSRCPGPGSSLIKINVTCYIAHLCDPLTTSPTQLFFSTYPPWQPTRCPTCRRTHSRSLQEAISPPEEVLYFVVLRKKGRRKTKKRQKNQEERDN